MELKEIVELLMAKPLEPRGPGHTIRRAFFRSPMRFMDFFELKAEEDRALLCSFESEKIRQSAEIPKPTMDEFVDYMDHEMLWPLPGDTTDHPWNDDSGPNHRVCDPIRTSDDLHNLWSGPKHRITKVFTDPLYRGQSNRLILMGEAILPGATLRIEKAKANPGDDPFELDPIALGSDDSSYHCCSVRQVYVRTTVDIPREAPTGSYRLAITNRGWNGAIRYLIQVRDR